MLAVQIYMNMVGPGKLAQAQESKIDSPKNYDPDDGDPDVIWPKWVEVIPMGPYKRNDTPKVRL